MPSGLMPAYDAAVADGLPHGEALEIALLAGDVAQLGQAIDSSWGLEIDSSLSRIYVIDGQQTTTILRGPDVGRSKSENARQISKILTGARNWWRKLDGHKVGVGGRHELSAERDPAKAEFARQAKAVREREPKKSWPQIAATVGWGGDPRTLQGWVERGLGDS
jgi:hypothetical protein